MYSGLLIKSPGTTGRSLGRAPAVAEPRGETCPGRSRTREDTCPGRSRARGEDMPGPEPGETRPQPAGCRLRVACQPGHTQTTPERQPDRHLPARLASRVYKPHNETQRFYKPSTNRGISQCINHTIKYSNSINRNLNR